MKTIRQAAGNPQASSTRAASPSGEGRARPASALERGLLKAMLAALGNPAVVLLAWDGEMIGGDGGDVRLRLRDPGALYRLALDPEFQFGELYSRGRLEVEGDLAALIEAIFAARGRGARRGARLASLAHPPRPNLPGMAGANIQKHYDIGNDFYRLWLDTRMLYTCAYFPSPALGLEQAQVAKMEHICRKLRLLPGERVVEAGCGWGALALHMAREYGAVVRAYNLSREQIAHARRRAREEGLDDRVEFVEADYREIEGRYDVFVSVGMLEHVGHRHYKDFAGVVDRCLGERGRGFIHAIGTDRPSPLNPWIERRIFPGAYPPSLREMLEVCEVAGFSVLDVENLRLHYAKTLEHWLARYEAAADQVEAMFGALFLRAWRRYLAGSLAAFRSGQLQLFQVLFQRAQNNDIPWSRTHLQGAADSACDATMF